ncbi:hypothetical protein FA13DRAFT_140326 [Coprinellus micaceus]|uniref:Uncharacterized protein n=1 Tax=Coprinellus micaceus TaxID=71717 RepID=A0A4Y7SHC9_COPMI|nr:hypothetical protein FA13DRAFT_140326 [Coprinellus micaceus]
MLRWRKIASLGPLVTICGNTSPTRNNTYTTRPSARYVYGQAPVVEESLRPVLRVWANARERAETSFRPILSGGLL